jgi:hypothetical protein
VVDLPSSPMLGAALANELETSAIAKTTQISNRMLWESLGGRTRSGAIGARSRNRVNLKRLRMGTDLSPRAQLVRVLATDRAPLSGGGIKASDQQLQ